MITNRKILGAYYTPDNVADYIVKQLKRECDYKTFIEPCFGDGVFIKAIKNNFLKSEITCIEINKETIENYVDRNCDSKIKIINNDFLAIKNIKAQVVIGNPPFVRSRKLNENLKKNSDFIMENLAPNVTKDVSAWLPFLLHSIDLVEKYGAIALVLPYEITFISYAKFLWEYLTKSFGNVRILRIKERIYPEIMQEVILLIAINKGSKTDHIAYEGFASVAEAKLNHYLFYEKILIKDLNQNSKIFKHALVSNFSNNLLAEKILPRVEKVSDMCKFHIGYVTGHKDFFHPTNDVVKLFKIKKNSLTKTISNLNNIKNAGLLSSDIKKLDYLFSPNIEDLSQSDLNYLEYGASIKVHEGYKCGKRDPWYSVPKITPPDLFLTIFSEKPNLLINDNDVMATNSLLCGYLHDKNNINHFVNQWYTPLTLLMIELEIHSLGGGMMVFVPNEVSNVKIIKNSNAFLDRKFVISESIKNGDIINAYTSGNLDLKNSLNIKQSELDDIYNTIAELKSWRVFK
jgi:adenine-specific DNA-methyltransferase